MRKWPIMIGLIAALLLAACSSSAPAPSTPAAPTTPPSSEAAPVTGPVTVYSGRGEDLIGPLFDAFTAETGIEVRVKYGDTASMAATILEEGDRSPADLFLGQDAGALGALAKGNRFAKLPDDLLNRVDRRFRSSAGLWVGTSARARVVAYNTADINPADLPATIWGFTEPQWKGRIGWPPTNASFQAFVTALRKLEGDERARQWLQGILANNPKVYKNNSAALQAVAAGEIDVAFINHYYLHRFLTEQGESFGAHNHYLTEAGAGSMVNVAGVGVLRTAGNPAGALRLVDWLLTKPAQELVVKNNGEYPLIDGVDRPFDMPPLTEIHTPNLDLSELDDLEATLDLLHDVGVL